jgi:hypothetical protein
MTIGTLVVGWLFVLSGLVGVHALTVWSDRREQARRRAEMLRVLQAARRNVNRPRVALHQEPPRGASLAARPILSDDAESGDAGGYPATGDAA